MSAFLRLEISKKFKMRFVYIFSVLIAFVFPIVHANFYYADDIMHTLFGNKSWVHDGRPLAYVMMLFLGGGVIDVSPWTQILGILILSLSLTLLSFISLFKNNYSIVAIPLIAVNPFFLENLSYRYDSFFMCFSMALSISPFFIPSFFKKISRTKFFLINSFIVLLCLNTYQPSVNVFLSLFLTIELIKIVKKEISVNSLYNSASYLCSFLTAMIVYLVESRLLFSKKHLYSSEHKSSIDCIGSLFKNYFDFLGVFREYFLTSYTGISLTVLCVFCFLFSLSCLYHKNKNIGLGKRLSVLLIFVLFSVAMFSSVVGLQVFLKFPTYNPRTFVSFGCFLFGILIVPFVLCDNKKKNFAVVPCFYFLLSFTLTSAAYSNAIRAQYDFWDHLALQMVDDTFQLTHTRKDIKQSNQNWVWGTVGDEPVAPFAKRVIKKYPFMEDSLKENLIMSPYTTSPWIIHEVMLSEGLPEDINTMTQYLGDVTTDYHKNPLWKNIENKIKKCDIQDYKRHYMFNTYRIENTIIVDYSKRC